MWAACVCRQYLEQEVALSEDMVHNYSDMALAKINKTIGDLRRLFLVEDLVDSIKVRTERFWEILSTVIFLFIYIIFPLLSPWRKFLVRSHTTRLKGLPTSTCFCC